MKPIKRSTLKHYNNIISGDDEYETEAHNYLERYQDRGQGDFINGSNIHTTHNNGETHHGPIILVPNEEGATDGDNYNDDNHGENQRLLTELKSEILYWKKFLLIGNSALIIICLIILTIELTTDVLLDHSGGGGNDDNNRENNTTDTNNFAVPVECLNYNTFAKENNVGSFFACATYCSRGNKNITLNSTSNELIHNLSSEEPPSLTSSSTTSTICSGDQKDNSKMTETICNEICEPMLSSDLEYFQTYISSVCDDEKIHVEVANGSKEELQLCAKECSPFDCCFSLDDDVNCLEENEVLCGAFFDTCLKVHENAAMFGAGLGPQILEEGN